MLNSCLELQDEIIAAVNRQLETIVKSARKKNGPGGYGTFKKPGKYLPSTPYVPDYSEIWSHLGTFKTQSYDRVESPLEEKNIASTSEKRGLLVDTTTAKKALWHFKYAKSAMGSVPPFGSGIDSKDWELFKLMSKMSVYVPILIAMYQNA